MPTVLYINGFRFYFYAGDKNEPAHVHVEKGDSNAKIWLEPTIEPKYFYGFKSLEKREILRLTTLHYDTLIAKWYEYFQ